ncbi:restriction endonuclease subunit S [Paracidovorax wautersii]|nr:restriction endonuclease subunit S [Paracidovorax wautersii]
MVELRQLVSERKGAVDPQTLGELQISYLGLENVRARTGELVDFEPRAAKSIKSRSKIFRTGDVLFGRLRPELNKVYLVDGEPADGICSGEFIVLVPIASRVNARYVRHIIASPFVSRLVEKFRVGASLPRMATDDLLSIKVPLPPLSIQQQIARQLEATDQELRGLRQRLEELPEQQLDALMKAIGGLDDTPN